MSWTGQRGGIAARRPGRLPAGARAGASPVRIGRALRTMKALAGSFVACFRRCKTA